MASGGRVVLNLLVQLAIVSSFFVSSESAAAGRLKVGFYKNTCPLAESIVRKTTAGYVSRDSTVAAALLRLHFHDCFVRGCDGSVLLNSTGNSVAEKDAPPNMSLDGFFVIDAAKAALEQACPGVVSCSDIVALAARDSVSMVNGPHWAVETGRRDGRISLASEALANLPSSFADIPQLISLFKSKGFTVKDLAVLSGAHTIGQSHCPSFDRRLYNFTGRADADPTLDPNYIIRLKGKCKPGDTTTVVNMDPLTPRTFDTSYYALVAKRRGLFHSDAALLQDKTTRAYVYAQLNGPKSTFFSDFGASMIKMGRITPLTGSAGEIRKRCAVAN